MLRAFCSVLFLNTAPDTPHTLVSFLSLSILLLLGTESARSLRTRRPGRVVYMHMHMYMYMYWLCYCSSPNYKKTPHRGTYIKTAGWTLTHVLTN